MLKFIFQLVIFSSTALFVAVIFLDVKLGAIKLYFLYHEQKARRLCREQWPETLLLMAAALKAGLNLDEAFDVMVKEASTPLREVLKRRLEQHDNWISLVDRAQLVFAESYLGVLKRSFILATQTGASYVPLLQSQAQILRKKQMMAQKISTLTAQSQLSAWIVGLSPIVLGLLLWLYAPEFIQPFFHSSLGTLLMAIAALFNAVGFLVIRRMLTIYE